MSRQALPNSGNSQSARSKTHFFTLWEAARLPLFFSLALVLTLLLASGHVTAGSLFQSPQSPPPEQPPSDQPAPPEPQPEQPEAEQPQPQPPSTEEAQPAPAEPQQPAPAQAQPTNEQPADPQSPPAQPTGPDASVPPTLEPLQPATLAGDEAAPAPPPDTADSPMVLDEAELIDSIVVSGAYLWLCCGVMLILLIPLFMLIVYVRGRSKIVNEESF